MRDPVNSIECAYCGKTFKPLRKWARFCCPKCKSAWEWTKKCAEKAPPVLPPPGTRSAHSAATPPGIGGVFDARVSPLRYRASLGDKDIRDAWAKSGGSEFTEELPAFLRRKAAL
jgi:predicted RNA-binding Zn-ribbon protein involved in translation (DUF1610 family)